MPQKLPEENPRNQFCQVTVMTDLKNFFSSVLCTMSRYAEVSEKTVH